MTESVQEPRPDHFLNFYKRYFAATRPAFLLASLAACLIGLSGAAYSGIHIQCTTALLTVLFAMLAHAGVNVLNDYFDAMNGTDAVNIERVYPYTGGSRFIQNGLLSPGQTIIFAYLLLGSASLGGLWLVWQSGIGLLWIGMLGMLIGWAYSAAPLQLNSRGLGEVCVLTGFLCLIVGADYVQRHAFSLQPVLVGMPYVLLVTNLLYINQFPDRKADAGVGKRNLVVMFSLPVAVLGYGLLAASAFAWLMAMLVTGKLPLWTAISVVPVLFSIPALLMLRQSAAQPAHLLLPIQLTLASMLGHALLLSIILFWNMS
ncbi:MAG: prenyltransferase [Betaproteobacteria bacterium HGW-Betaproteobacteria-22]|nr:MAG: prenyltransferase [Betaproteobacteria bacterium HGW-Betaproteobacteria-22]